MLKLLHYVYEEDAMGIALCSDSNMLSSLSLQSPSWQIGPSNKAFSADLACEASSSHSDNRLAAVQTLFYPAAAFMFLFERHSQQVTEILPEPVSALKY